MCCRGEHEKRRRVTCGKADGEPVTSVRINGIENIPDPSLMELTGNTDISRNCTLLHCGFFAALYLEYGRLFAHFQFLFSQSWLGTFEETENRAGHKIVGHRNSVYEYYLFSFSYMCSQLQWLSLYFGFKCQV